MIAFNREGSNTIVYVEHGVFNDTRRFKFDLNHDHDYIAELVRQALQYNLNKELARLKQKYYDLGWKQTKAKERKRNEFYGGWEK